MSKIKNVTTYGLIAGIYFKRILKTIISVGHLNEAGISILDFGCGHGMIKKILPEGKVINYDIVPELSDISDWRDADFDVVVANEVFYSFSSEQLDVLLTQFREKNDNMKLIVGISRQSLLNNIGKILLGYNDAHDATLLGPSQELDIIKKHMRIIDQRVVFFLMDVYRLEFK